jgi:hypothetical protein
MLGDTVTVDVDDPDVLRELLSEIDGVTDIVGVMDDDSDTELVSDALHVP